MQKPSEQSPLGRSPRHLAARDVFHRSRLPRHPPYALASNPTHGGNPQDQRTPDDRSSTLCDHKTIKQTTRPPTKGTRSKYISTSRPRPATPQGRPRGPLASTLQFSNHHATPHTPTRNTREGTHGGHPNANPHTRRPWRPGNPTACPYPPPQGGATILPRQHARHPREKTPGTMPGKQ